MIRKALPLVALLALVACNTVQGVGKDVSAAGNAISTGAKDVKNTM